MKRTNIFMAVIAIMMTACTSTENEPEIDNPKDGKADWVVTYKETCYSNPQWINQKNESKECTQWKQLHQSDLVSHTKNGSLDEEILIWEVTYSGLTEVEIEKELVKFVKFTTMVKSQPDDNNKYGSDVFEAVLTNSEQSRYSRYVNKSPLYWFDSSSYRYRIEYHENRVIQDGEWISEPPMLEDWSQSHYLSHKTETSNSRYRIWIEDSNDWTNSDVHTKVEPFISWSVGGLDAKSFHRFSVRVHDYKEDITVWHSKYGTTN